MALCPRRRFTPRATENKPFSATMGTRIFRLSSADLAVTVFVFLISVVSVLFNCSGRYSNFRRFSLIAPESSLLAFVDQAAVPQLKEHAGPLDAKLVHGRE